MKKPEQIGGELGGRGGAAFRQNGLPESVELGRFVRANPLDHDGGAFGEGGAERQRMRPGGSGEKFSLAFENRQVLGLHRLADGRDQDGRMIAGVISGELQRSHQRGRKILRRNGRQDLGAPRFFEGLIKAPRGKRTLGFRAILNPCVVRIALEMPARLLLHRLQP